MTTPPISPRVQATYRAYIVHTQKCRPCRSGTNCTRADQLRAAYKMAEQEGGR